MSGVTQSVHTSMGGHLEREVKNLAPYIAKLTAENVQQYLNKEVFPHFLTTWLLKLSN
jgi:hypothetical protein